MRVSVKTLLRVASTTLGVLGALFSLFRVGYTLTVSGVLVDEQIVPIG